MPANGSRQGKGSRTVRDPFRRLLIDQSINIPSGCWAAGPQALRPPPAWRRRATVWPNDPDPAADPNDNPITSDAYPRVPERYGVVQVIGDLRFAELSLGGKLTGPMDVPHVRTDASGSLVGNELARSDWFFTVDAALTRRWELHGRSALVASAGVRNLFNEYQDDLDSGVYRDSTYVYGPRFPRTFFASLRYEF